MTLKRYGIGSAIETRFKKKRGINFKVRTFYLNSNIKTVFNRVNREVLTGRKLFEKQESNIAHYKTIKCFRGVRHIKGLPVRGQRTHTNSTQKVVKHKNFL